MAAEQTLVDLRAVAVGCKVPYSTLARWAAKAEWPATRQGKRKLYPLPLVLAAVGQRAA